MNMVLDSDEDIPSIVPAVKKRYIKTGRFCPSLGSNSVTFQWQLLVTLTDEYVPSTGGHDFKGPQSVV